MPETQPSLLSPIESEWLADGLCLSHCRFDPQQLDEQSPAALGISLPPPLANAASKRRSEYLAGRACARAALDALNISGLPTLGDDRAPRWPNGAVGSLTHSHGQAAALVGDASRWRAIGVDMEATLSSKRAERVAGTLLTPAELSALDGQDADARAAHITLTFSVKESLFKALYPLTGKRFYFQDAHLDNHTLTLLCELGTGWSAGTTIPVQWQATGQGVLSWIALPRDHRN